MEEQVADRGGDAGSQRDMAEAVRSLGIPTVRVDSPSDDPRDDDPELAKQQTDEAIRMVRSVITSYANEFAKPFDFCQHAAGRRASRGLYFGPILPGLSLLHPSDPNHPGCRPA